MVMLLNGPRARIKLWGAAALAGCTLVACSDGSGANSDPDNSAGSGGTESQTGGGSAGDVSSGGASAGTGGGANGGMGGASSTAGAGGDAGSAGAADERVLDVDTSAAVRFDCRFTASEADDNVTDYDGNQYAFLDTGAASLAGKLVVSLAGAGSVNAGGTSIARWTAARGYHALGVSYANDYGIVRGDPDFYGDARLEAFDGEDHTSEITILRPQSIEERILRALLYLQALHPEGDWAYYLTEDEQEIRWQHVILTGISHGASSAPRIAMVRPVFRVVSASGPRDNSCQDDRTCQNGVVATWFDEVPETPIERFYALTGVNDDQHFEHLFAMEELGYPGDYDGVDVDNAAPPYGDSHRLKSSSGGHIEFCGDAKYDDACNYAFGVAEESQAGVNSPQQDCDKSRL